MCFMMGIALVCGMGWFVLLPLPHVMEQYEGQTLKLSYRIHYVMVNPTLSVETVKISLLMVLGKVLGGKGDLFAFNKPTFSNSMLSYHSSVLKLKWLD